MINKRTTCRKWPLNVGILIVIIGMAAGLWILKAHRRSQAFDLSRYDYRDTRRLVAMTGRAAAQKISEPELKELDMKPISKGLLADGFTTALAGTMGAMAVDTSSSNVGLAAATGAVSRWIAICAGSIFALLGFTPKLSLAISLIPTPVVGASMIFAVSFMICTGLQEMLSQKLDQRKIFAVGCSLIFGLGTGLVPDVFERMPHLLQIFFSEPLSSTTIMVIILYQVFHLDELIAARRKKKVR